MRRIKLPVSIALLVAGVLCFLVLSLCRTAAATATGVSLHPGVPTVMPAPNSHAAPITTTISATCNEDIEPSSVTCRTFTIHAGQTGMLTATYMISGNSVQFRPASPFHPGELVQVSATTNTLGVSGERPIAPMVWQFRTEMVTGTGFFESNGQLLGTADSRDVALGDLDGDGDLDAFVANCGSSESKPNDAIWLNDGTGTFAAGEQLLESRCSFAVELGDLDGDGDLDALVGTSGQTPNRVLFNDGSASFTNSGQILGETEAGNIALGDVNGDGALDAVLANRIWLNNRSGSFAESGQSLGNNSVRDVELGDLNNDGALDAFVTEELVEGAVDRVWFNDGSGHFTDSGQALGNEETVGVALGDIDGDGDLDAVIGASWLPTDMPNRVLLNNGQGFFTDSGQALSQGWNSDIEMGDLNGDGFLDIWAAQIVAIDRYINEIWINDGTGAFTHTRQVLVGTFVAGIALGDVDEDGDLDAFITDAGDGFFVAPTERPNKVWLNGADPQSVLRDRLIFFPFIAK